MHTFARVAVVAPVATVLTVPMTTETVVVPEVVDATVRIDMPASTIQSASDGRCPAAAA